MRIWDRLFGSVRPMDDLSGARPVEAYAFALPTQINSRGLWPEMDSRDLDAQGYAKIALIYRCITLIVQGVGTATLRVYDETTGTEIKNHPMRKLMRRPNPLMGESAFLGAVALRAAVAGFCVCEKERDRAGRVIGLWPLTSAWLKAKPRTDSYVDWDYTIPGQDPHRYKAEDVVAFRWAETPGGSPYGRGPLEVCMREAGIANALVDFLKAYIESGAVPMHGLILDTMAGQMLKQAEIDELANSFMARRGGTKNAARPMVLQGIKDIKKLGLDMNELAYVDLRSMQELGIIQAFGVPASVAQIEVGLQHSQSRANALTDEGRFYRGTMEPLWSRLDDAFTLGLLRDFEPDDSAINLAFDTSTIMALQDYRDEKAVWLGADVARGIISVHTYHKELDLPVPAGDDYFLKPLNVDVVLAADMLKPPPAPPPKDVVVPPAAPKLAAQIIEEVMPAAMQEMQTILSIGQGMTREQLARNKSEISKSVIGKIARSREKSLTAFFAAQGKRIIPTIVDGYAAGGPSETYIMESIDWLLEQQQMGSVLNGLYVLAGETAFEAVPKVFGVEVGGSFNLANPRVQDVMHRLAHRVVGITRTTRNDIADVVTAGLQEGLNATQIAANLTGLFTETYTNRAKAISRTESMVSYGEASVLAFRESGVVDRAQIFDNAEHTDPYGASDGLTCAERDGLICPLEEAMSHIYADHPNGSAVATPVLTGDN